MASPFTVTLDLPLTNDTSLSGSGKVLVATTALSLAASTYNVGPIKFTLNKIQLIDGAAQSGALDIIFLDSNKSFGAVNATAALSAADAKQVLHHESITSYVSTGSASSVASIIPFNPVSLQLLPGDNNLYVALISRSIKTWTANALTLRLSLTVGIQ